MNQQQVKGNNSQTTSEVNQNTTSTGAYPGMVSNAPNMFYEPRMLYNSYMYPSYGYSSMNMGMPMPGTNTFIFL